MKDIMKNKFLFYACHYSLLQDNSVSYLDSGYNNHMYEDENIFVHSDTAVNPKLRMKIRIVVKAKGKERHNIVVNTKFGVKYIRDVLVPDLKEYMLSVRQFLDHGYCFVFEDNMCRILIREQKSCHS